MDCCICCHCTCGLPTKAHLKNKDLLYEVAELRRSATFDMQERNRLLEENHRLLGRIKAYNTLMDAGLLAEANALLNGVK